ncbi:MAG TPA: DUF948 domain-containing protein [Bacillales bacterium]|nr:DUF948 domain-containing protein [Bacillales bacterium]
MIIVYLSLALAVLAIIYLIVSALRTFKTMKPSLESVSSTTAKIQDHVEGVQEELNGLTEKAGDFQQNVAEKKLLVQDVIMNVKWTGEEFKSLWKWAIMVPNPKKVEPVDLSPGVERIMDSSAKLLSKWKKLRR